MLHNFFEHFVTYRNKCLTLFQRNLGDFTITFLNIVMINIYIYESLIYIDNVLNITCNYDSVNT